MTSSNKLGQQRDVIMTGGMSGASRVWMLTSLALAVVTVGLASYIIYTEVSKDESSQPEVVNMFPGYFRAPWEQEIRAAEELKQYKNITVANSTTRLIVTEDNIFVEIVENMECTFLCRPQFEGELPDYDYESTFREGSGNAPTAAPFARNSSATTSPPSTFPGNTSTSFPLVARKKRSATSGSGSLVYHGCCISWVHFISPTSLYNTQHQPRTILQYDDQKQYFLTHQCRHASGCTGCTCGQETALVSAVVENPAHPGQSDTQYIVEMLKIPGCCKCFNGNNNNG